MCGLSNNRPFCDDSHKKTIGENDKTYVYDKEGDRIEVELGNTGLSSTTGDILQDRLGNTSCDVTIAILVICAITIQICFCWRPLSV
jgi:hypothetical protein